MQSEALAKALGPEKDLSAVSMAATWEDGAKVCSTYLLSSRQRMRLVQS